MFKFLVVVDFSCYSYLDLQCKVIYILELMQLFLKKKYRFILKYLIMVIYLAFSQFYSVHFSMFR